jgi:hypothetical protein
MAGEFPPGCVCTDDRGRIDPAASMAAEDDEQGGAMLATRSMAHLANGEERERSMAQFWEPTSWPAKTAELVLDRVGVELEATIIEETRQAGPEAKGIADVSGEREAPGQSRELRLEPRLQGGDDRRQSCAAGRETDLRGLAANLRLDGIEQRDRRRASSATGEPSLCTRLTKRRRTCAQQCTS